MKAKNRSRTTFLLSILSVCLAGCISSSVHGDATTYTITPWVPWSCIVLGALLFPAGLLVLLRTKNVWAKVGGAALMVVGPALLWSAAFKATQEYVTITDEAVEYGVGGIFNPGKRSVRFADCRELEFRVQQVAGDRGRPEESVTPVFLLNDGGTEDIGRIMFRGPVLDDLIGRLRKQGIPVVGDRRGL